MVLNTGNVVGKTGNHVRDTGEVLFKSGKQV